MKVGAATCAAVLAGPIALAAPVALQTAPEKVAREPFVANTVENVVARVEEVIEEPGTLGSGGRGGFSDRGRGGGRGGRGRGRGRGGVRGR
jgi:hypothetical protein